MRRRGAGRLTAGCWAAYSEVLAKEYGEYQYPAVHRLTVDAQQPMAKVPRGDAPRILLRIEAEKRRVLNEIRGVSTTKRLSKSRDSTERSSKSSDARATFATGRSTAQHPGTPSRQSIQSVAVHLISLYLVLERGVEAGKATQAIRSAVAQKDRHVWLDPPASLGPLTIPDVARATNLAEHESLVTAWAKSVWNAWAGHHETIREWAGSEVKK